jgi:two-component system, cell cycle sensor histidine kinase and response regulator CckA
MQQMEAPMNDTPVSHSTIILVVEDDQTLNTLIQRVLQRKGYKTEGFLSASGIFNREFKPDEDCLLLLDYSLPDMTGRQVLEKLRAQGVIAPFAMITGHGDELLAVEMMKLGAYDYIVKTGDIHELLPARVDRICDHLAEQRRLTALEGEKGRLQDQLRQSQKLEAIGQLAGGVAHDFNNLLGAIMGYAEVMRMKAIMPDENDYLGKILKTVNRAADLTRQLLTFARKAKVNYTSLDIHQCIRNVTGMLKHTIDPRIVLQENFTQETSSIVGDAGQIENALLNIGINARDAMPDGGSLIFATEIVRFNDAAPVRQRLELRPGKYLKISIRDTGTGMNAAILEKIFEPFYTTKELGKGTGLGLASVYGCVHQHNGNIDVESIVGKGSNFILYFPIGLHTSETDKSEDAPLIKGIGNILIVDDEKAIGEILGIICSALGYTFKCFSDSQEAIEYFRTHHAEIDAVLLDILMPKLSGAECFHIFKEIDPGVNVVIVSGYGDEKAMKSLKDDGVDMFVTKPFTAGDISKALAAVTGKAKEKILA